MVPATSDVDCHHWQWLGGAAADHRQAPAGWHCCSSSVRNLHRAALLLGLLVLQCHHWYHKHRRYRWVWRLARPWLIAQLGCPAICWDCRLGRRTVQGWQSVHGAGNQWNGHVPYGCFRSRQPYVRVMGPATAAAAAAAQTSPRVLMDNTTGGAQR